MTLKFLVDECTGKKLATLLSNVGYDVVFVGDWKPSALDEDILKKAEEENRILITDDKDFGELVFRLKKPSYGIILVRTSTTDAGKRFQMIDNLLKSIDVKKKFIVMKEEVIRIRNL